MEKNNSSKNEAEKFVGKVRNPWTIQAKTKGEGKNLKVIREAKEYKVGDKFETTNKKVFDSLINNKRIIKA